jgi:hypothetical protein
MITATADQVAEAIANDPEMLRQMHHFVFAVIGDDDLGTLLEELPAAIAQHSPFADEAALIEVVRAETLQALFGLTLRVLPARGTA